MANKRRTARFLLAVSALAAGAASALMFLRPPEQALAQRGVVPAPAASAGYTMRTFSVSRFGPDVVDVKHSYAAGFHFYPYNYFNLKKDYTIDFAAGALVASGGNASVTTAACANRNCTQFVGTAFGGGAYIEVEVAYDDQKVRPADGWPAVWMLAVESINRMPELHWAGQPPGFNRNVEIDLLEHQFEDRRKFSSGLHDWWGYYYKSCPEMPYCRTSASRSWIAPREHDFRAFHKIGMLWVPAQATRSGSMTFYYDGVALGAPITWSGDGPKAIRPPITTSSRFAWNVVDRQHMALIIGAGRSTPIRVMSVAVWQKSAAKNYVR